MASRSYEGATKTLTSVQVPPAQADSTGFVRDLTGNQRSQVYRSDRYANGVLPVNYNDQTVRVDRGGGKPARGSELAVRSLGPTPRSKSTAVTNGVRDNGGYTGWTREAEPNQKQELLDGSVDRKECVIQ
jgi:hypothetical protein